MSEQTRIKGRSIRPTIDSATLDQLSNDSKVLDNSCGFGINMACIIDKYPGAAVSGIDINLDRGGGYGFTTEEARRRVIACFGEDLLSKCDIKQGDARHLPFGDRAFTDVICTNLVHHLTRDGRKAVFDESYRVIGDDGLFFLVTISGYGLEEFTKLRARYGEHWDRIRSQIQNCDMKDKMARMPLYDSRTPVGDEIASDFLADLRGTVIRLRKEGDGEHYMRDPTRKDWYRLAEIAGNSGAFPMEGYELTKEAVEQDLTGAGFEIVYVCEDSSDNCGVIKHLAAYVSKSPGSRASRMDDYFFPFGRLPDV